MDLNYIYYIKFDNIHSKVLQLFKLTYKGELFYYNIHIKKICMKFYIKVARNYEFSWGLVVYNIRFVT